MNTMTTPSEEATPLLPKEFPQGRVGDLCQQIVQRLEQDRIYLDRTLSLSKFSSIVGTNTTYLSNAVNAVFGCNLKSLLNWYRVQHAKKVLAHHLYRLRDIPFVCGFASKSTFYVAFRKYEGLTPQQYMATLGDTKETTRTRTEEDPTTDNQENENQYKLLNL